MQDFNMGRYVPPEHEGIRSANQVSGKHALGSRARKAGQGILTVRFELPFAIWCTQCPQQAIIGQGVRFNAEKRRVGSYHSTTIWSFRFKHIPCGGSIEIRTDPKNTDYVVTEGARRRETGENKIREGDIEIRSDAEKQRLQEDAFAALEVKIDDRKAADADKQRIEELYAARDRSWDDPYAVNKRLRRTFRTGRKDLERKAMATEALQDRMSLGIDLLEETQEDRWQASQTHFGPESEDDVDSAEALAASRPLFRTAKPEGSPSNQNSTQTPIQKLQDRMAKNARSSMATFGSARPESVDMTIPGIKRKRHDEADVMKAPLGERVQTAQPPLVTYESD